MGGFFLEEDFFEIWAPSKYKIRDSRGHNFLHNSCISSKFHYRIKGGNVKHYNKVLTNITWQNLIYRKVELIRVFLTLVNVWGGGIKTSSTLPIPWVFVCHWRMNDKNVEYILTTKRVIIHKFSSFLVKIFWYI